MTKLEKEFKELLVEQTSLFQEKELDQVAKLFAKKAEVFAVAFLKWSEWLSPVLKISQLPPSSEEMMKEFKFRKSWDVDSPSDLPIEQKRWAQLHGKIKVNGK